MFSYCFVLSCLLNTTIIISYYTCLLVGTILKSFGTYCPLPFAGIVHNFLHYFVIIHIIHITTYDNILCITHILVIFLNIMITYVVTCKSNWLVFWSATCNCINYIHDVCTWVLCTSLHIFNVQVSINCIITHCNHYWMYLFCYVKFLWRNKLELKIELNNNRYSHCDKVSISWVHVMIIHRLIRR